MLICASFVILLCTFLIKIEMNCRMPIRDINVKCCFCLLQDGPLWGWSRVHPRQIPLEARDASSRVSLMSVFHLISFCADNESWLMHSQYFSADEEHLRTWEHHYWVIFLCCVLPGEKCNKHHSVWHRGHVLGHLWIKGINESNPLACIIVSLILFLYKSIE